MTLAVAEALNPNKPNELTPKNLRIVFQHLHNMIFYCVPTLCTVKHEICATVKFLGFSILNFSQEEFFCGFLTHSKVGHLGHGNSANDVIG